MARMDVLMGLGTKNAEGSEAFGGVSGAYDDDMHAAC